MPNLSKFIEEFKKTILVPIKDTVTAHSHPELHQKVGELCKQANIAIPNRILIIEEAFGMPNAMMTHNRELMLGENLLKTFGYNEGTSTITKELEAIIGHELGHSTRIGKDLTMIYGSLMGAPLLLYAGYKLYQYAKHRKDEKGHGGIQQHIEITAKEVEKGVDKAINETAPPEETGFLHKVKKWTLSGVKEMAIYTAASIASIPIVKLAGRHVEFAADAYGAKLVGKEHMASALKTLEQKGAEIMHSWGVPKFLQKAIQLMDYHPSMASRIAHLTHL